MDSSSLLPSNGVIGGTINFVQQTFGMGTPQRVYPVLNMQTAFRGQWGMLEKLYLGQPMWTDDSKPPNVISILQGAADRTSDVKNHPAFLLYQTHRWHPGFVLLASFGIVAAISALVIVISGGTYFVFPGVGVFFGLFYYEEQRYRHHDAWYSAVSAALVYDLSQGQGASELQSLGMRASVTNPPKMAVSRCNSALQVRGPTLAVERYM